MKVTLRGSHPPIWRRLEVSSTVTLEELHGIILAAFGWGGYHLWVFETAHGDYGLADPELGHRSASTKTLTSVAPRVGDKIRHTDRLDWLGLSSAEDFDPAAFDLDLTNQRLARPRRSTAAFP